MQAVVLVLSLSAVASAQPPRARPPRFGSRVEVVKLSVLVRGSEGPILGLGPADFEVRDNGVAQQVERVESEELPLSVILALDVSGSMKGETLVEVKRAAHGLVEGLHPGDRGGLVTLASTLSLQPALGGDFGAIHARIDALEAEGGTSLMDGAFAAVALGDAAAGHVLAMVFTDGHENASWLREDDVLDAARRGEVVVYGVRIGGDGWGLCMGDGGVPVRDASAFLDLVTSATGGRLVKAASPERLRQAFLEILTEFRTRYLLRYTPRGVERPGWHRLEVRVKGRAAKVTVRKGYLRTP